MSDLPTGGARPRALWLACALWCAAYVVPALQLLRGQVHAIPYRVYVTAGAHWLRHEPLYDLSNIDGFQYFPQAALMFAPLSWLGSPLGDLLFRLLGWSAYAYGVLRLARALLPRAPEVGFVLATVCAVGPAVTNLVNGQANLLVAALVLHSNVALIEQRWWRASLLLALGLALKPLMAAPLLMLGALYWPIAWRISCCLVLVVALPWLVRDHAYVLAQYRDCLTKLQLCADPDRLFEDLRGLLVCLRVSLSPVTYTVLRALAAVGVLLLGVWTRSRVMQPRASFVICGLAVSYLMLFNPRTLSSSYAMPGAYAALLVAQSALARRWPLALVTLLISVAWSVNHHVMPWVEHWLRPFACAIFFFVLAGSGRHLGMKDRVGCGRWQSTPRDFT